jgi:hypothetical protein
MGKIISTRRTTIAAALEYARSEHETLYREAGSTALESGADADEAQAWRTLTDRYPQSIHAARARARLEALSR